MRIYFGIGATVIGAMALDGSGGSDNDPFGFAVGMVLLVIGASLLQAAYERILRAVEK